MAYDETLIDEYEKRHYMGRISRSTKEKFNITRDFLGFTADQTLIFLLVEAGMMEPQRETD